MQIKIGTSPPLNEYKWEICSNATTHAMQLREEGRERGGPRVLKTRPTDGGKGIYVFHLFEIAFLLHEKLICSSLQDRNKPTPPPGASPCNLSLQLHG